VINMWTVIDRLIFGQVPMKLLYILYWTVCAMIYSAPLLFKVKWKVKSHNYVWWYLAVLFIVTCCSIFKKFIIREHNFTRKDYRIHHSKILLFRVL